VHELLLVGIVGRLIFVTDRNWSLFDDNMTMKDETIRPISQHKNNIMCRWTVSLILLACASWYEMAIPVACGFSFLSSASRRVGGGGRIRTSFNSPSSSFSSSSSSRSPLIATPILAAPLSVNLDASPSSSAAAIIDFYANLDSLYDKSSSIKCPFFRRRAADLIDSAAMVVQFLLIRHKSLPFISDLALDYGPEDSLDETKKMPVAIASSRIMDVFSAPGCKPLGRHIKRNHDGTAQKTRHLSIEDVSQRIRNDWTGGVAGKAKGYYITGKLDSTIYRDDCLFTGPDPDMPVRGLRKYLSAAAHLFDPRQSDAELLSMEHHDDGGEKGYGMIEVKWRLGGVIQLPWHPTVEPWTGTTFYHLDNEGLVYLHEEGWDISVWRAFICTLHPEAKDWKIWDLERTIINV